MSITLTHELRQAIARQPEQPLHFEDAESHVSYVLMTSEQFHRLVYDDSDLTPEEMMAAASVVACADDDETSTPVAHE